MSHKANIVIPSDDEDVRINQGISVDVDNPELTSADVQAMLPPSRFVPASVSAKRIRSLRTEADYKEALREIERYFDNEPAPGTPEAARFDALTAAINEYDKRCDLSDLT